MNELGYDMLEYPVGTRGDGGFGKNYVVYNPENIRQLDRVSYGAGEQGVLDPSRIEGVLDARFQLEENLPKYKKELLEDGSIDAIRTIIDNPEMLANESPSGIADKVESFLAIDPSLKKKFVDGIIADEYNIGYIDSPRAMKMILDVMDENPGYTNNSALLTIRDRITDLTGIDFSKASPKVLSGIIEQFIKPEARTYKNIEITESNAPQLAQKILEQSEGKIPDF